MRRVVVLRPEPGASATVERARERGLEAVAIPLLRVESVEWSAPEQSAFDVSPIVDATGATLPVTTTRYR